MSLLDNLADAWLFNEKTGQFRRGAHGGNTLTAYNGPERVAGHVGFATQFVAASSQHLSRPSTPSLSMDDDTGWWIWGWVRLSSNPASNAKFGFVSKQDDNVGQEYSVYLFNNGGSLYQLSADVRDPSNGAVSVAKTITPDTTTWHLWEAWYDPTADVVAVAWDHSTPSGGALVAKTTPTRSVGADFHIGTLTPLFGRLNGALDTPHIRKQAPTQPERDAIWNAGAGVVYPFGATQTPGAVTATIDNTGGSTAVPAGTPVPLNLHPSFFAETDLFWPNGDDLTATDAGDAPLLLWPDYVDRANGFGRVWVETPAGGVDAGASVEITLHYGDPDQFSTENYDDMFAKRTADSNTLALLDCDDFTGMTAVGSPTQVATDGGNFRVRVPERQFAAGGHIIFNGTDQYASVADVLDTPPPAGCVSVRLRREAIPDTGDRVWSKVNRRSGSTITEGLELIWTGGGNICARMTVAGVASEAKFEHFALPLGQWWDVVVSWGTSLQLHINGYRFGQAFTAGAWATADGTATPFTIAGQLLASAGSFAPIAVDELEVRDVEPSRDDVIRWFNRGGLASTYEHDRWTHSGVLLAATLTEEQGIVFEPRLERRGPGDWIGCYTGGNSEARLFGMTSPDGGDTLVKTNVVVMGHGGGGWAGDACRSNIFRDTDDSLHLFFSDTIGTTGGSIHHATTEDEGETWAHQGAIIPPDDTHGGWANTSLVKVDGIYYWVAEYSVTGGGSYGTAIFQADAVDGPLTLIDDTICAATLQQGIGSFSVAGLVHAGGLFHYFWHGCDISNLPSTIREFSSEDCVRWLPRSAGDPVVGLDHFEVLPRQDQSADPLVYFDPDAGKVRMLYDIDDNHGGGLQTRIMGAYFTGVLADLSNEYPQVVIGSVIEPPGPPPTPSAGTGAALLLVA